MLTILAQKKNGIMVEILTFKAFTPVSSHIKYISCFRTDVEHGLINDLPSRSLVVCYGDKVEGIAAD